jgi:hypothetical protein
MARGQALGRLAEFMPEQWGMVTAGQARSVGVSRVEIGRLIGDGALEAVPGAARVYRLTGAPQDPDRDPLRATWLQLGGAVEPAVRMRDPDAVVAGRSAALVLGLGDLAAGIHDFYVTRRRQLRRTDVRLRVQPLPAADWAVRDGLPVCTVPRLVTDLLTEHEDGEAVARICRDGISLGLVQRTGLATVVGHHANAYGAPSPQAFADLLLGVR